MRVRAPILVAVAVCSGPAVLAFHQGGYFDGPRATALIVAAVVLAVAALLLPEPAPPRGPALWALLALTGLTLWTALSTAWAPLTDEAWNAVERAGLYLAVLAAAIAAFRGRREARIAEPLLLAGAFVACCYGLLVKAGAISAARSVAAGGRLDQPLTYWNAMGALAAIGVVLGVAVALDATRGRRFRWVAALTVPAFAATLYLTYSRGAIAACAAGLVLLAAITADTRGHRLRTGGRWAVAALIAAMLVVPPLIARGGAGSTDDPAFGSQAARLRSADSPRYEYWRVALENFADHPLAGSGAGGFAVAWLELRPAPRTAQSAHSLPLQTISDLGVVGGALLAALYWAIVAGCIATLRSDRALATGPVAALTVYAFHSAIDWDWEMPALTLVAVALAAIVLARSREQAASSATAASTTIDGSAPNRKRVDP